MWSSDPELILEGVGIAAAPSRPRRLGARGARSIGWIRSRITTTPGRLVVISIAVLVGAVVFGLIATSAEQSRERAVRAARTSTEPLLVQSVNLYTALSDANATVATGLLAGGLESAASRARYLRDLQVASSALTALTRGAGSTGAPVALGTISDELPVYSGLVEAARANNRQGFPVGAAYLRQAAALLTGTMLRNADDVYGTEADRLDADYRTAWASASIVALIVVVAAALVLMLLAQLYVTRVSRRVFNLPMLVATLALAAVSVWVLVGALSEQSALAAAQREGSDSVETLSAANVLLSRAQGDLSLTLVNRGTDVTDPGDFTAVMRMLTTSGLAGPLASRVGAYETAANRVQGLESGGQLEAAIQELPGVAGISHQLSLELTDRVDAAQERFTAHAASAASALSGLGLALPLITALVALLALVGLRQRINEYR